MQLRAFHRLLAQGVGPTAQADSTADLRRLSNSGKNELVDDWVAAVEAADGAEVEDDDEPT